MFIAHSITHFQPEMNVDPEPKIFLQNKAARSQAKLAEVKPILQFKGIPSSSH